MRNSKVSKIVSFMLVMLFAFGIFEPLGLSMPEVTAYAADGDAAEKRDGAKNVSEDVDFWGGVDVSFAQQIRMATNYMNRQAYSNLAPGKPLGDGDDYSNDINISNVGVFFGYTSGEIHTDKVDSPEFVITEKLSATAVSYSRDQIDAVFGKMSTNTTGGSVPTIGAYADYGLMLNMMGFDNVGSDTPEAQRGVFGFIALVAYYGASSVNALFEAMFNVLEATNPFQFFKDVNFSAGQDVITEAATNADSAIGGGGGSGGAMSSLRKYISDIYTMFTEFAWAVAIPLALIFIIVAFFLSRNGRASFGSNIKKFLIRATFLVIGIPILGSAYTQVLTQLKDSQALSDDFITQAVSYTFLDFGAWVEGSRLSPNGVNGDNYKNSLSILGTSGSGSANGSIPTISATTWLNLRKMCSNLNYNNKVFEKGIGDTDFLTVSKDTGALLKDFIYEPTDAHLSINSGGGDSADVKVTENNKQAVMTLITKYMTGERYTASMYKNAVTSWISAKNSDNGDNTAGNLFALSANKYSFSSDSDRPVEGLRGTTDYYDEENPDDHHWGDKNNGVAVDRFKTSGFKGFDGTGGNLWSNGTLTNGVLTGEGTTSGGAGTYGTRFTDNSTITVSFGTIDADNGINVKTTTGFSTMAMFSYLTTKFSQKGFVCYGGAPSVYTQNGHFAVNLVGGDQIMQFAFFANMIAILGGYFLLAIFFVFRTAFEVIFKGFQLVGHALFAALGFYKSIGTVICMTVNIIAELFVSVIFFSFMVDVMFIVTSIFNHTLSDLFSNMGLALPASSDLGTSTSTAFLARTIVIASSFFATLVIIFFVSFAIRWRSAIMASLNSMVENIIGTLLGVQLGGASEGYMPGMAKAALNDTLNIAKAGVAGAGAVALADGASDMISDIKASAENAVGDDGEDGADAGIVTGEDISAADAAANPTENAGFDGGKGKIDGDAEADRDYAEAALRDGVGGHSSGSYESSDSESNTINLDKSGKTSDSNNTEKLSDEAVTTGSAEANGSNAASGNSDTYVDEGNNTILPRNGKTENTSDVTSETPAASNSGDSDMSDEADSNGVEIDVVGGGLGGVGNGGGHGVDKTTSSDKIETSEQTVSESTAASGANETTSTVESSVTEDEQGTLWSQTNPETGTETTARFDMQRGLVVGITNEDGTVSDVAVGMNGITTSSVDADGNEQTVAFGKNGIQTTYDGVDGTHETVDVDTANGTSTIYRTDADGNTEEIISDANGTVSTKTETAADGSTRVVTTDSDGAQTIEEKNATTGYEATETISADGSSVKTESLNGVTTVTNTNADGEMTAQTITKLDENGKEIVTSNSVAEDGSVTSSVTADGVTTKTVTGADGSITETQSVVRADGTVVETTTDYGTDTVADSVHTEVKSANGMETIQVSDTVSGKDDIGEYTSNIVKSASGTTETRDYGDGHIVTTETSASGTISVTETNGDGNYTVTETDAATGNISVTSLSSDGKGETVVRNANNDILSQTEITPDASGSISYTNAAGGSITMSTAGEGKDRENITVQGYVTGGQMASSVNEKSGSWTTTATDGMGSETVTAYDAKSGATSVQFAHINGNRGSSILESNGSFRQEVATVNGGVSSVVREGSGDNMTEVVTKIDAGGNGSVITSKGGRIERIEAMTGGSASYVQEAGENGSVITRQTLENGSVVVTTAQANGDYVQETTTANGAKSYVESTGGVVTQRDVSLTGIETVALRNGSAATETVTYGGIKMSTLTDDKSGRATQTYTTSGGQVFTVEHGGDGVKNTVELGDGNYGSFATRDDGSTVNIIRNAAGSRRVETAANGTSTVIYTDASGNVVPAPQGADTFNDAFANGMAGFAGNAQNVAVPTYMGYKVNNIIDNSQPQDTSGDLNLSGTSGFVATGTAPTYNGQSDLSIGVTRGGSTGVKSKSFLEKMYSRMIKSDETEVEETVETNEEKTTKRKLNVNSSASRLHRSDGKFGDYATRRGGSASPSDTQGDNTDSNK